MRYLRIVLGVLVVVALAVAIAVFISEAAEAKTGEGIVWVDIQPGGWTLGTYEPASLAFVDLAIAHDTTVSMSAPSMPPLAEYPLDGGARAWVWINTYHDWGGPGKPVVHVPWTLTGHGRVWLVDSTALGQPCRPNAFNHVIIDIESQGQSASFFIFDCDGFWERRSIGVERPGDVPADVPDWSTPWTTIKELYR